MQKPGDYLKESIDDAKFTLKLGGWLLGISLLLMSRFIYIIVSTIVSDDFEGGENDPWWIGVLNGLGILVLIAAIKTLSSGWKDYKKYRQYQKAENSAQVREFEVTDKFYLIKLLPGEDGPLEDRLFICDQEGYWRMGPRVEPFFKKLHPGARLNASLLSAAGLREIIDLKILHEAQAPENLGPHQIAHKVASEVKVTGYDEKGVMVNKWHLTKKVRYYFILKDEVVEVSRATFLATPLYSEFIPAAQER